MFEGMTNMFNPDMLIKRMFKRVDGAVWDITTGSIGMETADGEIATIKLEKDADNKVTDFEVQINPIAQFGMPVPAFAQNTPIDSVKVGDMIFNAGAKRGDGLKGWVTEINNGRFKIIKVDGTETSWKPPKVNIIGMAGIEGVMVLRSLFNMAGGQDGLNNISGMLLPMMMMGEDVDMDRLMPMMLMMNMNGNAVDADGNAMPNPFAAMGGNNNMMQTMMMMSMLKGDGGMFGKKPQAVTKRRPSSGRVTHGNTGKNWFDRK